MFVMVVWGRGREGFLGITHHHHHLQFPGNGLTIGIVPNGKALHGKACHGMDGMEPPMGSGGTFTSSTQCGLD